MSNTSPSTVYFVHHSGFLGIERASGSSESIDSVSVGYGLCIYTMYFLCSKAKNTEAVSLFCILTVSDTSPSTVYFAFVNTRTAEVFTTNSFLIIASSTAYHFQHLHCSGCSCTEGVSETTDSASVVGGVLSLIIILIIGLSALVIIILLIKNWNLKTLLHKQ